MPAEVALTDWPEEKLKAVLTALGWVPLEWQKPPAKPRNWWAWLLIGGRWSGKTELGSHYIDDHCNGEPCLDGETPHRIGVIAPTLGDASRICVVGETGLLSQNRDIRFTPGGKFDLTWPNGSVGYTYGAFTREDANRLRGPAHCRVWADEVAQWRFLEDTWNNMRLGLRLGPDPRLVGGTTPKPRKFLLQQIEEDPLVVVTRARTADNPYASATVKEQFYARYGGTRLGRQELEGEFLMDVPGALWQYEWIEQGRVQAAPELSLVVTSIDPAASHEEDSDETGIGAVGKGLDGHYYVLHDRSLRAGPLGWARRAIELLDEVGGIIIVEDNQGGDMVETTIRQIRREAPVKRITASKSKELRAQPVALLYEQGKVHHVGAFPELEEQLTTFTGAKGATAIEHDDRLDWLVHGVTHLMRSDAESGWGAA